MVRAEIQADSRNGHLLIRPQRSFSWRQNMLFLALVGGIYLATSVLLTVQGFWPVIPWAILDLALLFTCLYLIARAGSRREVIYLSDEEVRVERGRRKAETTLSAPRAQVYCLVRGEMRGKSAAFSVFLRLGRTTTEVGAALGPIEREQLLVALKGLLPVHEYRMR